MISILIKFTESVNFKRIICNLHNLKKLMFKANENLQVIFDDIRNILTPHQTGKMILTLDKVL